MVSDHIKSRVKCDNFDGRDARISCLEEVGDRLVKMVFDSPIWSFYPTAMKANKDKSGPIRGQLFPRRIQRIEYGV